MNNEIFNRSNAGNATGNSEDVKRRKRCLQSATLAYSTDKQMKHAAARK